MDQNNSLQNTDQPREAETDEINLLEYLLVIVRHKRLILASCAVTFVLACIVTLMLPNIYSSTARILPPSDNKAGIGSMLGGMGDLAALAGVTVGGSSGDLYVGMLQSRSIADAIIDRFNLMEIYEQKSRIQTHKVLRSHVSVSLGKKDGIVSVSVEDEDPELAANMANAFIEELKKLNVKLNLNNAGRERLFLEDRINVVRNDLVSAEENLKTFQEKNKAIRIDAQATAIIDAIAVLKGELASKEVELGVLRASQTEENPQIKALREAIVQIKRQLRKLEQSPEGQKVSEDIFMATSDVPELGVQYARLLRDFKIQETLFELLTRQYEVAKITEAKNTSTIQVLDDAVVADRKSKPQRAKIVIALTFLVGLGSVFFVFVREYISQLPQSDRLVVAEIWDRLKFKRPKE